MLELRDIHKTYQGRDKQGQIFTVQSEKKRMSVNDGKEIYDLLSLNAEGYENRAVNVFYQNDLFKVRVIVLEAGEKIPECKMDSYVMFYVVKGEVQLRKNSESSVLKENQVFISEPALIAMESVSGARLMGIQIKNKE